MERGEFNRQFLCQLGEKERNAVEEVIDHLLKAEEERREALMEAVCALTCTELGKVVSLLSLSTIYKIIKTMSADAVGAVFADVTAGAKEKRE